ncbi:Bax inhibitor-1/YccA family membrane protein [Nesterenkonia muleiensis]|uniref:Bax inhibitor-1/YccA family protein n=1 Tax=Nesterenkonia muleiensis TaxID=2282648 RepID=UPI000E708022|nr:Bax inhibitor-1/YccA family protein [Nesterenkonia muleiensis]
MANQFGSSSNPVFRSGAMPDQFNADKRRRFYMDSNAGTVREDTRQQQTYAQQHGLPPSDKLEEQYNLPAHAGSQGTPMTYDDVIRKTVTSFAVLLVGAGVAVTLASMMPGAVMGLAVIAVLGGLVLGLVNAFRREPNPALILAYSGTQGFFLGAFTWVLEIAYPGVAFQAVTATLVVFGTVLALFKSGKVRATPKLNKMFFTALIAYVVFSLINFGLVMFTDIGMFGMRAGWLGVAIGAFAILLATYSLVLDFTNIDEGVKAGVEQKYGWAAAFGLTVSLVWLYIEILRVIVILRSMAD